MEFATTIYTLRDGTSVKVEIWDTAGHEKYKEIVCVHLKDADGIILVFDLRNLKSFEEMSHWLAKIAKECRPEVRLMMLGNKLDLVDDNPFCRKIASQTAVEFSERRGIEYHETSVLRQEALHDVIDDFLEGIMLEQCEQNLRRRTTTIQAPVNGYCDMCVIF